MKDKYEIGDNEIRIVGGGQSVKKRRWLPWAIAALVVAAVVAAIMLFSGKSEPTPIVVDPQPATEEPDQQWVLNSTPSHKTTTTVADTLVDSIQLQILTPCNAVPSLVVGNIDTSDKKIVLASMAADLRSDNGKIVGAFVMAGEPLSWGLSKKGYCAIFNDSICIGTAENTSLFEHATEVGGYFFRQYPAVNNGVMMENNPKNKAFRRALCTLDGKICIIHTTDRVLMNDFSAALVSLGVKDAIFLVGSTANGWYRNEKGTAVEIGYNYPSENPNINFIVFKKQ